MDGLWRDENGNAFLLLLLYSGFLSTLTCCEIMLWHVKRNSVLKVFFWGESSGENTVVLSERCLSFSWFHKRQSSREISRVCLFGLRTLMRER